MYGDTPQSQSRHTALDCPRVAAYRWAAPSLLHQLCMSVCHAVQIHSRYLSVMSSTAPGPSGRSSNIMRNAGRWMLLLVAPALSDEEGSHVKALPLFPYQWWLGPSRRKRRACYMKSGWMAPPTTSLVVAGQAPPQGRRRRQYSTCSETVCSVRCRGCGCCWCCGWWGSTGAGRARRGGGA